MAFIGRPVADQPDSRPKNRQSRKGSHRLKLCPSSRRKSYSGPLGPWSEQIGRAAEGRRAHARQKRNHRRIVAPDPRLDRRSRCRRARYSAGFPGKPSDGALHARPHDRRQPVGDAIGDINIGLVAAVERRRGEMARPGRNSGSAWSNKGRDNDLATARVLRPRAGTGGAAKKPAQPKITPAPPTRSGYSTETPPPHAAAHMFLAAYVRSVCTIGAWQESAKRTFARFTPNFSQAVGDPEAPLGRAPGRNRSRKAWKAT